MCDSAQPPEGLSGPLIAITGQCGRWATRRCSDAISWWGSWQGRVSGNATSTCRPASGWVAYEPTDSEHRGCPPNTEIQWKCIKRPAERVHALRGRRRNGRRRAVRPSRRPGGLLCGHFAAVVLEVARSMPRVSGRLKVAKRLTRLTSARSSPMVGLPRLAPSDAATAA